MRERPSAVGVVLAGGRATRIGGSKATLELGGRPLIRWPLESIAEAGLEQLVVAKPDTELPELGCRVLREPERPSHPLVGIVAALRDVGGPIVAVGCDLPLVPPGLIRELAGLSDDVAVPTAMGHAQPLLARFAPPALGALEAALDAGLSMREAIAAAGARLLAEEDVARHGAVERIFLNINTAADLEAAEEMLAGG